MSKYLISLTPIGKFFFGNGITFQVGENKRSTRNEQLSSYIIHSNHFPQQTSLLGMLRFLLLSNNEEMFDRENNKIKSSAFETDNKCTTKSSIEALIGKTGFSVTNNINDFGKIKNIGYCFLQMCENGTDWNECKNLLPSPTDYSLNITFPNKNPFTINDNRKDKTPYIEKIDFSGKEKPAVFSPKEAVSPIYLIEGVSGKDNEINIEDIFIEDLRIGINRDIYTKCTDNPSLYKQISYQLGNKKKSKRAYRFAFTAEVEYDIKQYNGQIVSVGADSSQFILGIENDTNRELKYAECKNFDCAYKVLLKSDSYITNSELNNVDFHISDIKPFSFLKTSTNIGDYNISSSDIKRSKRFSLYKAGSVFYFDSLSNYEEFIKSLKSKPDFRQIGYNQFQ